MPNVYEFWQSSRTSRRVVFVSPLRLRVRVQTLLRRGSRNWMKIRFCEYLTYSQQKVYSIVQFFQITNWNQGIKISDSSSSSFILFSYLLLPPHLVLDAPRKNGKALLFRSPPCGFHIISCPCPVMPGASLFSFSPLSWLISHLFHHSQLLSFSSSNWSLAHHSHSPWRFLEISYSLCFNWWLLITIVWKRYWQGVLKNHLYNSNT